MIYLSNWLIWLSEGDAEVGHDGFDKLGLSIDDLNMLSVEFSFLHVMFGSFNVVHIGYSIVFKLKIMVEVLKEVNPCSIVLPILLDSTNITNK